MPLETQVQIIHTMVFLVIIYGCKSWTENKVYRKKVDALQNLMLERGWGMDIMGIQKTNTGKWVPDQIKGKLYVEAEMTKLRLLCFQHVMIRLDSLENAIVLGKC